MPNELRLANQRRNQTQTRRGARVRRAALLLHRYVGLILAVFLTVAGLTGSILAFQTELDEAINPDLFFVPASAAGASSPFDIARRTQPFQPGGVGWEVPFEHQRGKTVHVWQATERGTYLQRFIDPQSGSVVGEREWGNLAEGVKNLIPFIYRFHYSLGLGDVGIALLGIVALLWTVDCFVGAYVSLPGPSAADARSGGAGQWVRRWVPSWLVRASSWYAWIFTWHRASGLWLWGLLLVFAWSGVGFNLEPVYRPVMAAAFGARERVHETLPGLEPPFAPASLSPEQAYELARTYMRVELAARGAQLIEEASLTYVPEHGAITYRVRSSLDVDTRYPRSEVYLRADSGELIGFDAPTGQAAGNTITSWLFALHTGSVGGTLYRWVVVVVGLLVSLLSVTGVLVWWRKLLKRRAKAPKGLGKTLAELTPSAHVGEIEPTRS